MEFEPEEKEIVELLKKIKDRGGKYPRKMLASRRQAYLSQVASIGAGLGLGTGAKAVAKTTRGGSATAQLPAISTSTLVEALLVTAIVVQAGIVAYNYRDRLADFFRTFSSTPTIVEIVPSPRTESSAPEGVPSLPATPTSTDTPTTTVTTTGSPTVETGDEDPSAQTVDATATPQPKDDNGNHFGQTPRPTDQPKNDPKPTKKNGNGKN